jgi:hypothetical protein
MMLCAAVTAAFLVDQVAQAPVAVQCVQAAPEPTLKWLLPTLVQTVVSLVSIGVGVGIAVWSFRRNRQSEHEQWERNQTAEHEQWIRDESRAEWKLLLAKIAEIEHAIPILITGVPDHRTLKAMVLSVLPQLRGTIFIYSTLEDSGFISEWESFVQYISGRFMLHTETNRSVQTGTLGDPVFPEDRVRWRGLSTKEEIEVRDKFHAFVGKLRGLAHKSLGVKEEQP